MRQCEVLEAIKNSNRPLMIKEIAETTGYSVGGCIRMVKQLTKYNLIKVAKRKKIKTSTGGTAWARAYKATSD